MESSIHILLIEDNPADVRLIREYLSFSPRQSYELFQSSTLKGGHEILRKEQIDIILLDLHLPDSLGLKSFDRLMDTFPNLPIIVLTGLSDEDTGLQAVRKGAQDFLSKDELNSETLIRCIRYGIERHQMLLGLEEAQKLAKMGNWEYVPHREEVHCSKSAKMILALPQDAGSVSISAAFACIHDTDRRKIMAAIADALLHQTEFKVDAETAEVDGKARLLAIKGRAKEVAEGGRPSVVGTVQDVTDRMEKEELIREKELAIKSAQHKQEFLATTSHEIRTPLNAILQLTRILVDENPRPEQIKYLNLIKNAGSTLLAVVNDVLDFSKIEAGKMDFSQSNFELLPLIDSVIAIMELKANEEKLTLNKFLGENLPKFLVGDPVRLNQILLNLINNAIKYTKEGFVNIHVRLTSKEVDRAVLEFCVEDSGIGIPSDKLDAIFMGFQRLDSDLNRKYSGTGLGLTIVEQLVKLQGGKISVESQEGLGSTFTFSLPFKIGKQEVPVESTGMAEKSRSLEGAKVLLVEDNPLNQMVTEHLLYDWGIDVTIAANGKIAIDILSQKTFDLVLMDLQMPVMDGYDTTRYIRTQLRGSVSQIPIIALTANAFYGMDDECMKIGMNDYLSKPFEKNVLFEKIKACIPHIPQHKAAKETPLTSVKQENMSQPSQINSSITDLTYLNEVSSGDHFIFNLAINKYLEKTPESLELIDKHFGAKEYDALAKSVHKLKSSVATMGMATAKDTILQIENILRNDLDKAVLPALIHKLKRLVEQSFEELRSILSQEVS